MKVLNIKHYSQCPKCLHDSERTSDFIKTLLDRIDAESERADMWKKAYAELNEPSKKWFERWFKAYKGNPPNP